MWTKLFKNKLKVLGPVSLVRMMRAQKRYSKSLGIDHRALSYGLRVYGIR